MSIPEKIPRLEQQNTACGMAEAAVASTSRVARAADLLVALRKLITEDPVALHKWPTVVDDILKSETEKLRIKLMLKESKFEEAVLQTLQAWHSHGAQREDLLAVFRANELDALAERVMDSSCKSLLQNCNAGSIRGCSAGWFEVTEVVGNFTGRDAEIQNLHKRLTELHCQESSDRNVVSIVGLRGVGKSTLARKYAFEYRKFYDGNVVWINAETVDTMRASFIRLSPMLNLLGLEKLPNEELAAKVFEQLSDEKCLLIFDNVEEKKDFKQFQPKILNPDHSTPYVLLTTCRTDFILLPENQFHLDVLTKYEAVQLIQKMLPKSTRKAARKLAHKLQRFPLALQQALAFTRDKYLDDDESIVKYLQEFKRSEELLNDERFKDHNAYSFTTFATFTTSLGRIKENDDGQHAIAVISSLAYLNPDTISTQFMRTVFEEDTEPGLRLLDKFSMVRVSDGKVAIHRLVQQVVRLSFCDREEEVLQKLAEAIRREFRKEGAKLSDAKRECTSHGLHLFPFQMSHKNPEAVTANCNYFDDLCYFLNQYGNEDEALSVSQQMAALYESVKGEEHGTTIMMKWRRADAYSYMGKYSDSLPILNSILPVAKSTLGSEHRVTMGIQSRLGHDLSQTGDSEKAVQIYNEMIQVAERARPESEDVLTYKANKARALSILRKYDQALELLQHVLEKRITLHGEDDGRTLAAKFEIAFVHYGKREFSKALRIWEEVEVGYGNALGDTHPNTVLVRKRISICKEELSRRERSNC